MSWRNLRPVTLIVSCLPLLLAACGRADTPLQSASDSAQDLVIRGGWIFDGINDTRSPNTGIVIRDGKFLKIGADLDEFDFPDARVITLDETATILPGMFDLHAHYNMDLVDVGRAEDTTYNPLIFLANGVTSTWPAGEFFPERVLEARDRVERGEAIGPRIFASGPYFGAFRCEYQIQTAEDDCAAWPNDITEEEIRAEVNEWADRGVRSIKIKQASPSETQILIDQAHKRGMTTAGHLANYKDYYDVDPKEAIRMGIDRVEHWITLGSENADASELRAMIDLFLENGVYYDANLQMYGEAGLRNNPQLDMVWTDEGKYFTPYTRERFEKRSPTGSDSAAVESEDFKQRMVELKALYDAGGGHLILIGTDEPVYGPLLPGFAYHRELLATVYAGLPPVAALKAATINGARALGVDDRLGSIESGKLADLYIAKGNPLEDITAARNVQLVIKEGVVYEPQTLLKEAEGKIGPSGPDDHDFWELKIKPLVRR